MDKRKRKGRKEDNVEQMKDGEREKQIRERREKKEKR